MAILLAHLCYIIFTGLHFQNLGLDVVKRQRTNGCRNTGNSRAEKPDESSLFGLIQPLLKNFLDLSIGNKCKHINSHSSSHCGDGPSPHSKEFQFFIHFVESIKNVLVVSSLFWGKTAIWLESDQGHVKRICDGWSNKPGEERVADFLSESHGPVVLSLDVLLEGSEQAETNTAIDKLSENGRV